MTKIGGKAWDAGGSAASPQMVTTLLRAAADLTNPELAAVDVRDLLTAADLIQDA